MRSRAAGVLVACLAGLLSIQLVGAPPARAAGPVTAGASTSAAGTTAGTSVVVPKPAGVVDGDILIAQITADGAPSVSAAPAGWSTVVSPLAVGNSARVFAYYRVIPTASAEPASYTWRLSSSVRWNAVMTDFHGVDTTTPFDTVARTRVNTSNSNTVAVPGVTTTTAGAMLVGGVGPNSASVAVTPPTSWTESIESRGGQTAELAYQARPTVGATGTATWRLGSSTTAAGWLRALRPAAGGTPPGPTAPTASFTRSPASGTAPLTVSFTDTSTGSPTSWAWNFGDSGTATTQNPSHTYSTAGTYQVTLTATNAGGSNTSAAQTVTVNPADPGPTAPVASFTRSPASGTVPLTVAFTDTSTGSPTSWAWNFGDGGSATTQNPSHTYSTAGTYQVTLTATNAAGSSTSAAQTVTVNPGGGGGSGAVTAGSFTSASGATAGTAVTVPKPAGVVTGDVLVAQINADLNPDVSAAPAGWSTVIAPRSNGTGNRLFAYYKVITNAAGEPGSYTWTLSAAVKWNAGIADFHGVDSANPWDSAASGATGAAATSLTVPGVTTTTAGAMLIGGVGFNSTTATASPPSGWTELGEPTGGQNLEVAGQARPAAGVTGNAVWTFSGSYSSTGWLRALRPGGAAEPPPPPPPTAPTASFTATPLSGVSPLTVQFTDTSTGSPTSWAWDFDDETSSTERNPSHTFTTGTYVVSLTASNANGTSAPATRTITVTAPPTTTPTGRVSATVETVPVANSGDAADDVAIWVNQADPARSTVIGTNKRAALLVYDLAGQLLQTLPVGEVNNVDVRPGFDLAGVPTSLVTVSNRTDDSIGIFAVDPVTRLLRDVAARKITTNMPILGACMYRNAAAGTTYVLVTSELGAVQQWQLTGTGAGTVDATMVRTFAVGSIAEGCVADDDTGALYVAEESGGIWRYGADPAAGSTRTLVAGASNSGPLVPTIEGLTLTYGPNGTGYLFASSQGDSSFAVYRREGANDYVGSFEIVAGGSIDGAEGTDGIDVTTANLGPAFPSGVFVAQDGQNNGNQNFKLVPYERLDALLN